MVNGLNIDEKEFLKLPQKERDKIIFRNTEELKTMVSGFKFHQKVQYAMMSLLLAATVGGKVAGFL